MEAQCLYSAGLAGSYGPSGAGLECGERVRVWFYLQDKKGRSYDWYAPLKRGTYQPEYVDEKGHTILTRIASEIATLARRDADKQLADMDIIVPATDIQTGGKFASKVLDKVDEYLRESVERNGKAVLALNSPTDEEEKLQKKFKKKHKRKQ